MKRILEQVIGLLLLLIGGLVTVLHLPGIWWNDIHLGSLLLVAAGFVLTTDGYMHERKRRNDS